MTDSGEKEKDTSTSDDTTVPAKTLTDVDRAGHQADLAKFLRGRFDNAASVTVNGDLVMRDKVQRVRVTGVEFAPQVLPKATIKRYRQFAAPACLDVVRSKLVEHSVVVLAGRAGWGKYALGLNLLFELGKQLHTFEPTADLRMVGEHLGDECGYLVDGVTAGGLRDLSTVDVERLVDELEKRKALLVLTVTGDIGAVNPDIRTLVADLGEPPTPKDVLICHLRGHTTEADVQRHLADPEVLRQLESCVTSDMAYQLALDLADTSRPASVAELSARQALKKRAEVEKWIGETGDPYWPYLFSAAVLDGLRRDLLVKGGADIARAGRVSPLNAAARIDLFEKLQVGQTSGEWSTPHGEVLSSLVRFHQWAHQPLVLDLVWRHGVHLREPMFRWLRRMGEHDEEKVRLAAGAAVGQLMVKEFSVFLPLIQEWAASEERSRDAAVAAVMVAAANENLRLVLWSLTSHWAFGSPAQRWTAARVLGRPLGSFFPELALRRLRILSRRVVAQLLTASSQSMVELAEDADERFFGRLVSAVHDWVNQDSEDLRTSAVFVFLQMCVDLEDATSALPRLLEPGEELFDKVVDLWRIAIVHPKLHEAAVKTAGYWARSCESHAEGPRLLARMFGDVPLWSRQRGILVSMATAWTSGWRKFPKCASAVMTAMDELDEGDPR